jgi:hypothetical protein
MSTPYSYTEPTPDAVRTVTSPSTETEQYEVRCGMCAKEIEVGEEDYRLYAEALISGLDNPFRCEVCNEEYDDLAYEG